MSYFEIDAQLPSLNEYVYASRSHWSKGAEFKKSIESLIGISIRQAIRNNTLAPIKNPCYIKIRWYEKTMRRDVDNIQSAQKFILDALQHYGILKNDSRRYVTQIYHEVLDDTKDHVIVRIISGEPDD